MDNSKYSYDLLKDAVASFEKLTAEEKALVSNAATLDAKKADLSAKMGKELDFTLNYEDYFKSEENEPPVDVPPTKDDGSWVVVVIVVASVVVAAAAATAVFFIIRKKKLCVSTEASADGETEAKED